MAPSKVVNATKGARNNDGTIDWDNLLRAAGTTSDEIQQWSGHGDGIYVKYASGECRNASCKADHCVHWDCPRAWANATATTIRRGVAKLREEEAAANEDSDE